MVIEIAAPIIRDGLDSGIRTLYIICHEEDPIDWAASTTPLSISLRDDSTILPTKGAADTTRGTINRCRTDHGADYGLSYRQHPDQQNQKRYGSENIYDHAQDRIDPAVRTYPVFSGYIQYYSGPEDRLIYESAVENITIYMVSQREIPISSIISLINI